jgi:AraC-like DNA-binding protein
MTKVPGIWFDTADLPEAHRFDAWRTAMPHYDLSIADDSDPHSFRISSDAWMLGDMVVTTTQLSPVRFVRSAARVTADGCRHFSLVLPRRGSWSGDAAGRSITLGPGQIMIFDLSRPFEVAGAGGDTVTVTLTRAAVEATGACDRELHGLALEGLPQRVLADHLMLLIRQLPIMDDGDTVIAVRATAGLIGACVAATPATAAVPEREDKVRHRVNRHIDAHLGRRDLTLRHICREIGVSRSVLYRAFAPLGGVADYIRTRRLEAAHVLLETPDRGRNISSVAADLGFVSEAHFSRVFKERYGYSPRGARDREANALRELAALSDTHASAQLFKAWVAQISHEPAPAR